MAQENWTQEQIPSQENRRVAITGANSGIGLEAARELARQGAHVIMACRSLDKGRAAMEQIQQEVPEASLQLEALDLADLSSVRDFAQRLQGQPLDILCNNAGVMALPYRKTQDGFEMQLGTNHLGHFALTLLLLGPLGQAPAPRVVTVSSQAHRMGSIRFHDLQWEKSYQKWLAYGQSKLANLLFAYELARKLEQAGSKLISAACHPGYSNTNLQTAGPRMSGSNLLERISQAGNEVFAQPALMGALPTLYAATAPEVRSGDYIGPDGWMEWRGYPVKVKSNDASRDQEVAQRLWEISEQLTGVSWEQALQALQGKGGQTS